MLWNPKQARLESHVIGPPSHQSLVLTVSFLLFHHFLHWLFLLLLGLPKSLGMKNIYFYDLQSTSSLLEDYHSPRLHTTKNKIIPQSFFFFLNIDPISKSFILVPRLLHPLSWSWEWIRIRHFVFF